MKCTVEYRSEDDCLLVRGELKTQTEQELESAMIKTKMDTKWVINASLMIGENYIDNNCGQVDKPYVIRCDYFSRAYIKKFQEDKSDKLFLFEKNNVTFWFEEMDPGNQLVKGITFIIKLSDDKKYSGTQLPQVFNIFNLALFWMFGQNWLRS